VIKIYHKAADIANH